MSPVIEAILKRSHQKFDLPNGAVIHLRPITNGDNRIAATLPEDLRAPFLWSRSLVDESGDLLFASSGDPAKDAKQVGETFLDEITTVVMSSMNEAFNVVNKFTKQETIEKK